MEPLEVLNTTHLSYNDFLSIGSQSYVHEDKLQRSFYTTFIFQSIRQKGLDQSIQIDQPISAAYNLIQGQC